MIIKDYTKRIFPEGARKFTRHSKDKSLEGFRSIWNHPPYRLSLIIGSIVTCVFIASVFIFISRSGDKVSNELSMTKEEMAPGNFFDTIPEKIEPPQPKIIPIEPEYKITDLLPHEDDQSYSDYVRYLQEQRQEAIYKGIVSGTTTHFDFSDDKLTRHRVVYTNPNRDEDFSDEEKVIPSYPVHLERVLTMNKFIPAVLYTEVRSDIPSEKVQAIVEQDVVGFHGRKILIPKGTRAIGRYASLQNIGDRRLNIMWYRMITPDGININLRSNPAEIADQEGAAGMTGEIDHRWADRYGTGFLFATINAAAQFAVPVNDEEVRAAANSYTEHLGQVTAEALREGLKIKPVVRIPKGARITISPLQDVWFAKPRGGGIEVMPYNKT